MNPRTLGPLFAACLAFLILTWTFSMHFIETVPTELVERAVVPLTEAASARTVVAILEAAPQPDDATEVSEFDALADEARAAAERRQVLANVARVEHELAAGDSDGARAVLLDAAERLGGEPADELREAVAELDAEDLAAARELIAAALLGHADAQEGDVAK
jgi:hypothetical protein